MKNMCECSDPGCPVHPGKLQCKNRGNALYFRIDMEDESGTLMCNDCGADALDSGVFATREES